MVLFHLFLFQFLQRYKLVSVRKVVMLVGGNDNDDNGDILIITLMMMVVKRVICTFVNRRPSV